MPTPPPSASSRGRCGSTVKPWPIGASTLTVSPGWREPERLEAVALRLVQELEPPFGGARAHDRQRPAHRDRRVAGHVRERAGRRASCRARRVHAQDELIAGIRALREDPCILEKHAAAIALVAHSRRSHCSFIHCSAIKHAASSVDAALADAAAKIPGTALLGEVRLCGDRRQRLVDGARRVARSARPRPPRTRARAARSPPRLRPRGRRRRAARAANRR